MKMPEITCYNDICDYKPDYDYDYCLLSFLLFIFYCFINVI